MVKVCNFDTILFSTIPTLNLKKPKKEKTEGLAQKD